MSNAANSGIVSNSGRNGRSPVVTHEQLAGQAANAGGGTAPTVKKAAFKKAQLYINPGQWQEDEEGNPIFVSLPFGLGLDNMSKSAIRGGDRARHQQALSNALLDMLSDLGFDNLEPGKAMMLEGMAFELRWKRGDEAPEIDQVRAKSVMSTIKLVPRVDAD
jgi:hypothetical protein